MPSDKERVVLTYCDKPVLEEGTDIFKHGASPELQAHWDELDAAIEKYPTLSSVEKGKLLDKHPSIKVDVMCLECGRDF